MRNAKIHYYFWFIPAGEFTEELSQHIADVYGESVTVVTLADGVGSLGVNEEGFWNTGLEEIYVSYAKAWFPGRDPRDHSNCALCKTKSAENMWV